MTLQSDFSGLRRLQEKSTFPKMPSYVKKERLGDGLVFNIPCTYREGTIIEVVKTTGQRWVGHVLRKEDDDLVKRARALDV